METPPIEESSSLRAQSKLFDNLCKAQEMIMESGLDMDIKYIRSDDTLYITYKLPLNTVFNEIRLRAGILPAIAIDTIEVPKILRMIADIIEMDWKGIF